MASDLSQDAVLHFLRSGGGSVKNADLLLHFRDFIRDHADRDRNREQFKKYVNTVATVQQLDGVSYVVLRRKFRGRVPGGRGEGGPGGARREPSPGNVRESPALSAEKPRQKPQHLEVTTTAPPGEPASKTILPAAGIMMNNNNNVEASFNLQQQQEVNKQELHSGRTPRRLQPPPPDQSSKMGQTTGSIGPPYHGTTPVVGAHGETRQQIPIHEPFRGRETEIRTSHFTGPPAQEWSTRVGQQKVGFGPGMGHEFYAVRRHGETRHQVLIPGPPTREAHNFSEPAAPHRSPNLGQHMGGYRPPQSGITHGMTRQQRPIQEALRGREAGLINPIFSEPPGPNRSPKLGQHMMGFAPHDPTIYGETRQQIPIQGPLRGWEAEQMTPNFSGYPAPNWSPKLGQYKVGFAPHHPGITGEARQQIPVQEPHRAQEPDLRDPGVPELPAPIQSPKQGQHEMGHGSKADRMAPKVAAVRSNEEPRLHVPVQESELRDPSPPSQDQSPKKGQHNAGFGPPPSRQVPVNAEAHRDNCLETPIQESIRGQEPKLRDQSSSGPPAQDQSPKFGQHKMGLTPLAPEMTPEAPSVKPQEEIIPDLETLRHTKAEVLNKEPPSPAQANPNTQVRRRRHRHRKSYKSAISCDDEEEEEEEEEVTVRCGSAGGEWPVNRPLGNMAKAISTSSPCIIDVPSVSVSSMDKLPQIFVQDVGEQTKPPRGNRSWSSESGEELRGQRSMPESSRHSLPLEAEHHVAHTDRRLSQPPVVHLQQSAGVELNQRSTSNIYSPSSDSGLSMRDWPMSSSPGGSGWSSSLEDLHARTDNMRSDSQMQGALLRAKKSRVESSALHSKLQATRHHSTGNLHDDHEPGAPLSPLYHSNEHLHGNQLTAPQVMPKNLSTGDLHDDHQQAGLSKDSPSTPTLRHPSGVPRRLSSHLRNRMCLSMGADLDQLMQEEERVEGGSEAARLNRLHLLSSSLSLRYNLSSSSLSSCSTPPRSQSLANLTEAVGGREGRKSLPSITTTSSATEGSGRQSQVPLESREHDWLVKGAAGVWPDIYTLFREDSTLLNRRDFISGFTVLHWIAKHGDHRVLNTLWYGVQKAGLTFDINARSSSGHTPLHIAAIHGHKNIMRLLVSKFKADVKLRDMAGKRAWQYLSGTSTPEIFQLLGAPPRAALGGGGGAIVRAESTWTQERQHPRRRRRHHLSSASSAERPQGISAKVKRSSSIAAFLKHKSLQYLRPSDSMV